MEATMKKPMRWDRFEVVREGGVLVGHAHSRPCARELVACASQYWEYMEIRDSGRLVEIHKDGIQILVGGAR
jgi:hypothetical protein